MQSNVRNQRRQAPPYQPPTALSVVLLFSFVRTQMYYPNVLLYIQRALQLCKCLKNLIIVAVTLPVCIKRSCIVDSNGLCGGPTQRHGYGRLQNAHRTYANSCSVCLGSGCRLLDILSVRQWNRFVSQYAALCKPIGGKPTPCQAPTTLSVAFRSLSLGNRCVVFISRFIFRLTCSIVGR